VEQNQQLILEVGGSQSPPSFVPMMEQQTLCSSSESHADDNTWVTKQPEAEVPQNISDVHVFQIPEHILGLYDIQDVQGWFVFNYTPIPYKF
jgi:hypothetical protein